MSRLGESAFPPIHNADLLDVDTYSYGAGWKISAKGAQRKISSYCAPLTPPSSPTPSEASMDEEVKGVVVIDSRESSPNTFSGHSILAREWKLMDTHPGTAEYGALGRDSKDKVVILICYEGLASSVGASVLRSRGIEAFWVEGGMNAWGKL
ncbi:hypothetical protein FRC10_004051 [Ceratobasidium sp. 414]|nr:hypothetical protein FRC10_004051 [Ceratobasidium sp. 414]